MRFYSKVFLALIFLVFPHVSFGAQNTQFSLTASGHIITLSPTDCSYIATQDGGTGFASIEAWTPRPQSLGGIDETNWAGSYGLANTNASNLCSGVDLSFLWYLPSSGYTYFFLWANGASATPHAPIGYFKFYYDAGTDTVTPVEINTTTRIIDFIPHDSATTTNPVTFSLDAYVNPSDIGTFQGVDFSIYNLDQNISFTIFDPISSQSKYILAPTSATTSGEYFFSTSTILAEGNYMATAKLERTDLGFLKNPFSSINETQKHMFVVGQPTYEGNMQQQRQREIDALLASSTATTTQASANTCNPLGGFNAIYCIQFLFTPDSKYLGDQIQSLRDNFLNRVPWGYLTRFAQILSSSATSSLPTYTVVLQEGSASATTSLTFDPGDMLAGGASLLDSIQDPINGKNDKDVFEPMVLLGIALMVLLTIVADITGSHRHQADVKGKNT